MNPAALLRRAPTGIVEIAGRLGWGVADQGVSSLSNFALGAVVARALGPESFGAFTLAYVTYSLVLNASRGIATDPLAVRFSGPATPAWRRAVSAASATTVLVGVIGGLACLAAALVMPDRLAGGFLALGVGLPGLMLQDAWRFTFFSVGRPVKALVNDLVWGALQVSTLLVLVLTHRATVLTCVLAFGGTATVAAGLGLLQSRIRPRPERIGAWVRDHRDLGGRYLIENVSVGGARQIRMFALGGLGGLAAVGEVRAAEMLMGPFLVVVMGVSQVAVPEAAQVLARYPTRLGQFCVAVGVLAATGALAWGVTIWALLPHGVGHFLLGTLWVAASHLLLPVMLTIALSALEIGAAAGVRALGAAPRSLIAQMTTSGLYVVGGGLGAYVDGARGSCWGVLAGVSVGVVVWWVQLGRGLRDHLTRITDRPQARSEEPTEVLT